MVQWSKAPDSQLQHFVGLEVRIPAEAMADIFLAFFTAFFKFFWTNHISMILYHSTVVEKALKMRIFVNCMVLIYICPLCTGLLMDSKVNGVVHFLYILSHLKVQGTIHFRKVNGTIHL